MHVDTAAGERGESLLEILLTVAIMGIAFAAVLAGVGTIVSSSGINRGQAYDTSYVRAIAERVEQLPFDACATTYDVDGAVPAGSSFTVDVTPMDGVSGSCESVGLQKVTITTVPKDERASAPRPLDVMKRRP